MSLTQEQRNNFESDGFLKLNGFYSAVEIDEIQQNFERFKQEVLPQVPDNNKILVQDDPEKIQALYRMDQYDDFFAGLIRDSRLKEMADDLMQEPSKGVYTQYFNIVPGIGKPTPPHQDAINFRVHPAIGIAFWIPLVSVDESNGCLCYVRGSHKDGFRRHMKKFGFINIVDPYLESDKSREEYVSAEPGDLVMHTGFTIHQSAPNVSARHRSAIGAMFHSARSEYFADEAEWIRMYSKS